MRTRLDRLDEGLRKLAQVLEDTVEATVRDNKHILEDANTEQLSKGKRSDGSDITPEYAPLTLAMKHVQGRPLFPVLKDSGDYYTSIIAKLSGKQVELVATDPKADELEQKYGPDIVGLPDEALDEFRQDYVKPDLQQAARNTLGL